MEAIHEFFGLSYANYLTVPRSMIQSMPDEWQEKFVALLHEMREKCAQNGMEHLTRKLQALLILREWGMGKNYHAGVLITVRDWIDSGMRGPIPWPGGALFEAWAEKHGLRNIDGFVGAAVPAAVCP